MLGFYGEPRKMTVQRQEIETQSEQIDPHRLPSADHEDPSATTVGHLLTRYLQRINQVDVPGNVAQLMSFDGFAERFDFFCPRIPKSAFRSLLISGCAVGSEHLVALRYGFQEIYGVEITSEYASIAKKRLEHHHSCHVASYDGEKLPYENGQFSMVYSGHVIEHTPVPEEYFRELLRVLEPGGFMFLEFPNRYHWKELHTGTPSVEWLPKTLRALILKTYLKHWFPLPQRKKALYRDILHTLQPISIWQIRRFLAKAGSRDSRIIAIEKPCPGFVRILLRK